MTVSTVFSRDFDVDASNAKCEVQTAPATNIVDMLVMLRTESVRFNPPRVRYSIRAADLDGRSCHIRAARALRRRASGATG